MAYNGTVPKRLVESQRYRLHGRRAEAGSRDNNSNGFIAIVVSASFLLNTRLKIVFTYD